MSEVTQILEELKSNIYIDLPANQFVMESMLYVPKQYVTDEHIAAFTYYLPDEITMLDGTVEKVKTEVQMYEDRGTHIAFHRGNLAKVQALWPMMSEEGMLVDLRPILSLDFPLKMTADFQYRLYKYAGIKPEDLRSEGNVTEIMQKMTDEQGNQIIGISQRDCLLQYMDPNLGGIFKAFPGFGKTVVMCIICASMGLRTLMLARKKDLLEQFMDKMRQFTNIDDFRWEGDGQCYNMYKLNKKWSPPQIGVSTYQYLSANPEFLHMIRDLYSILIADECHRLGSEAGTAVFLYFNSLLRMGFSATPFRRDGIDILFGDIIGPIRLNLPSPKKDAICYIIDTHVKVPQNYAHFQFPMNAVHGYLGKHEGRNELLAKDAVDFMEQGRKLLILTYRVNAIDTIWYAIEAEINYRASLDPDYDKADVQKVSWIYQNTTDADRKSLSGALEENRLDAFITTSQLFSEGSDIPCLDTLMVTYPTANKRDIEQIVGRITREYDGKPTQIINYYRDGGLGHLSGMAKGWVKNMGVLGVPTVDNRVDEEKVNMNRQALFGPKNASPK
ncbi:DEAD/DEAH box helicase [Ewingella americana]|uniref:Helicase ATP-binding domain-containing protein n=1 Tax=Ewingella americana TaxID=41202 RepID=A0A502GFF1_9GAMM|nr:DEAD/DEAH box helicase family protein [Ewingella americana]TPG60010.1 hypothetical protein EAH77_15700 [Ewingella americana]